MLVPPIVERLTSPVGKPPGSLGGWILVESEDAGVCYEHAAEWAEFLNWEVTPVFSDEQAGPLIAKVYS